MKQATPGPRPAWATQPRSQRSRPTTTPPAPKRPAAESAQLEWQRLNAELEQRDARLRAAASYVTDALYNGWADAVAERAAKYVTQQTWWRIRSGWPRRRCDRLARLALRILEVKNQLHEATGSATAALTKLLGRSKIEGVFAAELAERIPLPLDTKLDTLARTIRITGVMLCVSAGRSLRQCAGFCDLAEAEGQEQAKRQLLSAADRYWADHYQPPSG
jgi:hypothetical protein